LSNGEDTSDTDLLGRGGEAIALSAASYLYSMANFGEPWTTGVRNACLVLEKLDFSKEHREANLREIISDVNDILGGNAATYEYPGFIKLGEFNFRTANGDWNWDQDGTDNHGTLGFGLHAPTAMIAEAICLCYTAHTAFRSRSRFCTRQRVEPNRMSAYNRRYRVPVGICGFQCPRGHMRVFAGEPGTRKLRCVVCPGER